MRTVPNAPRFAAGLAAAVLAVALTGTPAGFVSPALAQATAPAPAFTPSDENPEDFPAGTGRDEAFYACTACHNFKLVAAQGMDRERWDASITFMIERHNMPALDGDDRKLVLDYLEKSFPPKAPAGGGWQSPFAPR